MIRIKEAIVVEGRYDVNTVKQVIDTVVFETCGFQIFSNNERLQLLRRIAAKRGLLILTDSDGAGFVIRNYLRGVIPPNQMKQAYIPNLMGKEKRKAQRSKEGFLGVEGMTPAVIEQAIRRAGATVLGESNEQAEIFHMTKADFYEFGLSGRLDSAARRKHLLRKLNLPQHMTANALLEYINAIASKEEIIAAFQDVLD